MLAAAARTRRLLRGQRSQPCSPYAARSVSKTDGERAANARLQKRIVPPDRPAPDTATLGWFGATRCRFNDHAGSIRDPDHGGHIMSIVVRFSPTSLTANKYDETIRQLKKAGE